MLANVQRLGAGQHWFNCAEHIDDFRWDVFKFHRNDIHGFRESFECCFLGILGIHLFVGYHACCAWAFGLKNVKPIAERATCNDQHAAELTSAKDANGLSG